MKCFNQGFQFLWERGDTCFDALGDVFDSEEIYQIGAGALRVDEHD